MKYPTARNAAKKGELVRRADWDNALRMNASGDLEFVQAVHQYGKVYPRAYEATDTDLSASDWIVEG